MGERCGRNDGPTSICWVLVYFSGVGGSGSLDHTTVK